MFYMPHGLTVDAEGNMYVTDTGLHQVMRVKVFAIRLVSFGLS